MTPEDGDEGRSHPKPGPVLLLDDDDSLREALVAALHSFGCTVIAFETGEAMLESLPALSPACFILDFDLPRLNGLEIQQMLLQRGEAAPVIFLSASTESHVARRARDAGAIAFMTKPVHIDDLHRLISRVQG